MSDLDRLAARLDRAPDIHREFATLACCLERCCGDIPAAMELSDLAQQFDEEFERFHPRQDDGRFREKSKAETNRHRKERMGERREKPRKPPASPPPSEHRRRVEETVVDPEVQQILVTRAARLLGADLRTVYDPEDIVQSAVARAIGSADEAAPHDVLGWLKEQVRREAIDVGKGHRAMKRGAGRRGVSLDEEIGVAEEVAEASGLDAALVMGRALRALDPEDARLLDMHFGLSDPDRKYTAKEIAKKIGLPTKRGVDPGPTIRKRLQRARERLRAALEDQYGEREEAPPRETTQDPSGKVQGAPAGKHKPPQAVDQDELPPGVTPRMRARFKLEAEAAQGKIWHRKPAEKADVRSWKKGRKREREGIHDQFDVAGEHNVDPLPDHIAAVGARAAQAAMDAARETILDLVKKNSLGLDDPRLIDQIERVLDEVQPTLAQIIAESTLAGAVRGADEVLQLVPGALPEPPANVPPGERLLFPEGESPIVRFPVLEEAARRLSAADVLSPQEFYKLGSDARRNAFTIAGDLSYESLQKIQQALAANVMRGASFAEFASAVDGLFEQGMPLSRAHLEQVFRNNVNGAWSDGHDRALRHPLVHDSLPYRAYTATHDQRVRDEHLLLEHSGLSGTNVYLASDPVWQMFRPPWAWSCRCSFFPMSIQQAAEAGVEHAKRWLAEAEAAEMEPEHFAIAPEYVPWPSLNGEQVMPPAEWKRSAVQFGPYDNPRLPKQRRPKRPTKSSGLRWGKVPAVSPLPHASRMGAEIQALRERYPRLAGLPDVTANIELELPPGRGAGYRRKPRELRSFWKGFPGEVHRGMVTKPKQAGPEPANLTRLARTRRESEAHMDRHEYGHHLWTNLTDDERQQWQALHEENLAALAEISEYGASHPKESFAEIFGLFTHRGYGQEEHLPRLPPAIEAFFRRLLGVS